MFRLELFRQFINRRFLIVLTVLVVGFMVHFAISFAVQYTGMGFIRGFDYAAGCMQFLFGLLVPIVVCMETVEALSKDYTSGMIEALFFENVARRRILETKIMALFLKVLSITLVLGGLTMLFALLFGINRYAIEDGFLYEPEIIVRLLTALAFYTLTSFAVSSFALGITIVLSGRFFESAFLSILSFFLLKIFGSDPRLLLIHDAVSSVGRLFTELNIGTEYSGAILTGFLVSILFTISILFADFCLFNKIDVTSKGGS